EAHAKLTGKLGVAMVTAGPGSTNAITGVASAWVNSVPTLFLSGQVKKADLKGESHLRQLGLQEIDIVSIVRPIPKSAATVIEPTRVRFHVEKALHEAVSGRPGPVWLAFPLDVQAAEIDLDKLEPYVPPRPDPAGEAAWRGKVASLLELLDSAERPVLLAGAGIRAANAQDMFLTMAERIGVPVQTTWSGADLMAEDHPLFAGRPGSFAPRGANFALQNCDFLLSLGARLDLATTGYSRERLAPSAQRGFVDIGPAEIGKMRHLLRVVV